MEAFFKVTDGHHVLILAKISNIYHKVFKQSDKLIFYII